MTAEELKVAINILPELTERKRIIDTHLQISTALLEQIKSRDLGDLFHLEQQIISENTPTVATKNKVLEVIRGKAATRSDKLRLFLIYYLTVDDMNKGDLALFEGILREAGLDLAPLAHIKHYKSIMKMSTLQGMNTTGTTMGSPTGRGTGSAAGDLLSLGGRLTGGVLGNVLNTVKNLLPESTETPLTKVIDGALDMAMGLASTSGGIRSSFTGGGSGGGSPSPRDDQQFALLDPKLPREQRTRPFTVQRSAFSHLIVFVVGGSNYAEYNHAMEFVTKKMGSQKMSLTFGSTDILSGEQFLAQLAKLGQSV